MGVVIVPPVGYEYWTAHRTLRTLAERLAAEGCLALRFDFDGTGDSAGDQWDPDRVEAWLSGLDHAADALRRWGVSRLVIVGLRVGGAACPHARRGAGCRCRGGLGPRRAGAPLRERAPAPRAAGARGHRLSRTGWGSRPGGVGVPRADPRRSRSN